MTCRNNDGFSLVEMLVAIVILGMIAVPVSSGMLTAVRINTKAEELLKAQLAVSSTVETWMARGINKQISNLETDVNGVAVTTTARKEHNDDPYYVVTVSSGDVIVTTYIREVTGGDTP